MRKREWRSGHGLKKKKNSASIYVQIRIVLTYAVKSLSEAHHLRMEDRDYLQTRRVPCQPENVSGQRVPEVTSISKWIF